MFEITLEIKFGVWIWEVPINAIFFITVIKTTYRAQHWSTQWPGSTSIRPIFISPPLQSTPGLGHLVLNTQPGGGFNALGISPFSSIASDLFSGSIDGIEDNNAFV